MSMHDWLVIAKDIAKYYKYFDAFIVLHGTDTLAYTASALAFMLEDLGKTVILTGAQVTNFSRILPSSYLLLSIFESAVSMFLHCILGCEDNLL